MLLDPVWLQGPQTLPMATNLSVSIARDFKIAYPEEIVNLLQPSNEDHPRFRVKVAGENIRSTRLRIRDYGPGH
jgi:hypothetical protein